MRRRQELWVKPEVRKAFEEKMLETIAKCQPYSKEPIPTPKLEFCHIGAHAGLCVFNSKIKNSVVTINPLYFKKEGGYNEQLNDTCPHETAHHIAFFIYGCNIKPHGLEWARTMSRIGLLATRCHHMDDEGIAKRHPRPYKYLCGCPTNNEHFVTANSHSKVVYSNGKRWIICKRCRQKLTYAGLLVNGHFTPAAKPRPVVEIKPIHVETFEPPKPKEPEGPQFRVVTRFINGTLQNIRIPIDNNQNSDIKTV